jgi:hypothetical protein
MNLEVAIYGCGTCGAYTLAEPGGMFESNPQCGNCGRDRASFIGSTTLDVAAIETAEK